MKPTHIVSLALLSAVSLPAFANWQLLDRTPDNKVFFYYEPSSINKDRRFSTVYQLDDFAEAQVKGQYIFQSIVKQVRFNCAKKEHSLENLTIYTGRMGEGTPLNSVKAQHESWLPVLPQTAGEVVMKKICK